MATIDAASLDDPLFRAAELRALGNTWSGIALKLGMKERKLRRKIALDPARWRKYTRAADGELLDETYRETLNYLRVHMRSKKDDISMWATEVSMKFWGVNLRHKPKKLRTSSNPSTSTIRSTAMRNLPSSGNPSPGKPALSPTERETILAMTIQTARTDPSQFAQLLLMGHKVRDRDPMAKVHEEMQAHLTENRLALVELPRDHGKTTQANGTFRLQTAGVQQGLFDEIATYPFGERDDLLVAAATGASHLLTARPEPRVWIVG